MRHVCSSGGPMVMFTRSGPSRSKTSGGGSSSVRIMVMRDKTIDHSSVGMIEATSMVMRSRCGGKHCGGITGGVSRMMRSEHSSGAMREFDGRQGLGRDSLIGREELRESVEMMREIGSVMRVVRMRRVGRMTAIVMRVM